MVDTSIKNQIVSVFKDTYLSMLKSAYTWYATKTPLSLTTHLYSQYVCIPATDMFVNDKNIRYHYNAEEPLKGIIKILN